MVASSLSSFPAFAQITGNEVTTQRTIPPAEQVDSQTKNSRYRLGPIYLIPVVSLGSVGYVNNLFGTSTQRRSDYTASIGAGTQWLVPFGAKVYLRGTLAPSYIWYAHSVESRKLGWTADQSMLFLFNHLSIEARGNSSRLSSTLNTETYQRVLETVSEGSLNFQVLLTNHVDLIGGGEAHRYRFENSPRVPPLNGLPSASDLDRTEKAGRGGFRYRFSSVFAADAVYEETRAEFTQTGSRGDSRTTAYLLGLNGNGNHFVIHLSGGYREGKSLHGSAFPEYSIATGSYAVSWIPRETWTLQTWGHRETQYSLFSSYYFENLAGAGFRVPLGIRFSVRAFGEHGTNQYPNVDILGARRRDKVTAYGGGIDWRLLSQATLNVTGLETRYTSNVPGFTRSIFQVTGGFSIRFSNGLTVGAGESGVSVRTGQL